ncbi:MAG: hypothetical protein HC895_02380 [Leptolyngbyaceae cyanobacterium SM1_3_5]|nr:hypothetical protein [Leptolyngbyaceae cyanobacterium SM1_3_5]
MNQFRTLQINLAGLRSWLVLLAVIWLLGSIGLGWLVKSLVFLFGLLLLLPTIGFFVLRWWLKRNLIEDSCPVCQTRFVAINNSELRCPNCSEPLTIDHGRFHRLTPPGTVDVDAIEVPVSRLED